MLSRHFINTISNFDFCFFILDLAKVRESSLLDCPLDFTQTERKVSQKSVSSHPNPRTSWRGLMEFDEAFMQMYRRPSSTTFLVKWSSGTRVIRISLTRYINQAFWKKYQNDFHRSAILVTIIKQTTYLIFLYLLIRYEISVRPPS